MDPRLVLRITLNPAWNRILVWAVASVARDAIDENQNFESLNADACPIRLRPTRASIALR